MGNGSEVCRLSATRQGGYAGRLLVGLGLALVGLGAEGNSWAGPVQMVLQAGSLGLLAILAIRLPVLIREVREWREAIEAAARTERMANLDERRAWRRWAAQVLGLKGHPPEEPPPGDGLTE